MFNIKAFWIFTKKFGDVFVTKNIPKELDSCLYQLAYGEIGFLIHRFDESHSSKNLDKLSKGLLYSA